MNKIPNRSLVDLPPKRVGPDWSQAPEWATYKAQNPDGSWYWFESKPDHFYASDWQCAGRQRFACWGESTPNWKYTLETRP